jgi:general secretion pathway protein A
MYESFYGLNSKPFQLNPDPSFYFGSKQHKRASAYLEYGMHRNEGFIVITGEVGAGKTTIVRGLLGSLDPAKVVAAHLVSTQLDAEDTLRLVAAAFGLRTKDVSKADVLMTLEAFLINSTRKGQRCLLIVDEAQNLTPRAVEELRMLSNFQFGNHALLQSFLIGQPEFREILQSPHMQQLRQRVIASCHIGPMDAEETRGYVEHRLKCAGSTGSPTFDDPAYQAIHQASGGVPRRINSLCDRLLLLGFLGGKKDFAAEDVEEVAREIHEETLAPRLNKMRAPVAPADDEAPQDSGIDSQIFDLNLSQLEIDAALASEAADKLNSLSVGQLGARLVRLERSLLRLERVNSATLAVLQQLVRGASKTSDSADSESA